MVLPLIVGDEAAGVISLAHSLRRKVVAEGVEAEDQAKLLRLLHCDQLQGCLISKPVPFERMTTLLTIPETRNASEGAG